MNWLRVSFPSDLEQLQLPALLVNQVCRRLGLDEIPAYQIELCAVEAFTNAIRHAYREAPGHEVTLLLRFDSSRIEIEISDQGVAMDAEHVQLLESGPKSFDSEEGDPAAVSESGRGLRIMRVVMDRTSYTSSGGTNCVSMTKYF